MKGIGKIAFGFLIVAALISAAEAAQYYKVTDKATGRIFYTKKMEPHQDGNTMFRDARTGLNITLEKPNVAEITKDEYVKGMGSPQEKPVVPGEVAVSSAVKVGPTPAVPGAAVQPGVSTTTPPMPPKPGMAPPAPVATPPTPPVVVPVQPIVPGPAKATNPGAPVVVPVQPIGQPKPYQWGTPVVPPESQ